MAGAIWDYKKLAITNKQRQLVKPCKDRKYVVVLAEVNSKPPVGVEVNVVPVSTTLSKPQTQQAKEFLQRNRDTFFKPAKSYQGIWAEHCCGEPKIAVKSYRISKANQKAVLEEVQKILELDISE